MYVCMHIRFSRFSHTTPNRNDESEIFKPTVRPTETATATVSASACAAAAVVDGDATSPHTMEISLA